MPKGTIRVYPISDDESVMYVRVANDTEADAHFIRRDAHAIIRSLAELAASIGIVRLSNGDAFSITGLQYMYS